MVKYKANGRKLTDHEREILGVLQEECGEVIAAASKILRFGNENVPPTGKMNHVVFANELGQLWFMIQQTRNLFLFKDIYFAEGIRQKQTNLKTYLQYPGNKGCPSGCEADVPERCEFYPHCNPVEPGGGH